MKDIGELYGNCYLWDRTICRSTGIAVSGQCGFELLCIVVGTQTVG